MTADGIGMVLHGIKSRLTQMASGRLQAASGQLQVASGWLLLRPVSRYEYITKGCDAEIWRNCPGENVQQVYLVGEVCLGTVWE